MAKFFIWPISYDIPILVNILRHNEKEKLHETRNLVSLRQKHWSAKNDLIKFMHLVHMRVLWAHIYSWFTCISGMVLMSMIAWFPTSRDSGGNRSSQSHTLAGSKHDSWQPESWWRAEKNSEKLIPELQNGSPTGSSRVLYSTSSIIAL